MLKEYKFEIFNATGLNPKTAVQELMFLIDGKPFKLRPGAMIPVIELSKGMKSLEHHGKLLKRPYGATTPWKAVMMGVKDYEIPEDEYKPFKRVNHASQAVVANANMDVMDPSLLVQRFTSLLDIEGLKVKHSRLLKKAGVESLEDLARITKAQGPGLAKSTRVNVGILKEWVLEARRLVKENEQ